MRDWFKAAAISFGKALATATAITLIVFALLKAEVPSTQYFAWLGNIAVGNLGFSRTNSALVVAAVLERFPATLQLIVASFVMALLIGLAIAFLSIQARSSIFRRVIATAILALECVPFFWLALLLQFVVIVHTALPNVGIAGSDNFDLRDRLSHLIAPAGTLALFQLPFIVEYIRKRLTATTKTAPHAGWAAGLFGLFAGKLPEIVGAVMITEVFFAWPGEGRIFFIALSQGDMPLLAGWLLLSAISVLMLRLIAELVLASGDRLGTVDDV